MRTSIAEQRLLSLDVRFGHLKTATTPLHFRATLWQIRNWLRADPLFAEFLSRYDPAKEIRLKALAAHISHYQQNAFTVALPNPETFDDQLAAILAAIDAATAWRPPPVAQMVARTGSGFSPLQLAMMALGHVTRDEKTGTEMCGVLQPSLLVLKQHLAEYVGLLSTTYSLIQRYKERTELFNAAAVRALVPATGRKEGAVATDLYMYLHDRGLNFIVEPSSASGEPDLVSVIENDHRLIVDVKYVHDKNEAKRTLVKGFRQVLDYCSDHNQPSGFLVVYLNEDIRYDIRSTDGFGGMKVGDHVVQFCVIDIFGHTKTASQRPKPNVIEISIADLVATIPSSGATSAS